MANLQSFKKNILQLLSRKLTGHIPLYHACYPEVPDDINWNLHNVTPDNMFEQLSWYKKNFDIVSLEEWFSKKSKRGLATITFDDAYESVFKYGIDVLEALNLPATVFVIGSTLEGEIFWRDKIRFLERQEVLPEFVEELTRKYSDLEDVDYTSFYEKSKTDLFSSIVSNQQLNLEMDEFIRIQNLQETLKNHCLHNIEEFSNHPLISYGNHSYNHYMLNTLDSKILKREITKNHEMVKHYAKNNFTDVLSIPFGGWDSITDGLLEVCKELDYKAILLSTNHINGPGQMYQKKGVPVATRFLMPENKKTLISMIDRMSYDAFEVYKPNKK